VPVWLFGPKGTDPVEEEHQNEQHALSYRVRPSTYNPPPIAFTVKTRRVITMNLRVFPCIRMLTCPPRTGAYLLRPTKLDVMATSEGVGVAFV
jgi:hypothetical protein